MQEITMTKLRLKVVTGALLALSSIPFANLAAAGDPLSPWEKFCLNTSAPGQALANCLDGLPSRGGKNKKLVQGDSILPGISVPLPPPSATGSAAAGSPRRVR
jgi:hypothetical protein